MNLRAVVCTALLAVAAASGAADARARNVTDPDAPRSLPEQGPVSVRWTDPSRFSDIRHSRNRAAAVRGDWVRQIAEYLRERAARRLPPGQRLEVEIRDIKRAGEYEPWHGVALQDTRFIREIYPPRIDLYFRRLDADGRVAAEGERELRDSGFMMGADTVGAGDALRFEKDLIDRWLGRELPAP